MSDEKKKKSSLFFCFIEVPTYEFRYIVPIIFNIIAFLKLFIDISFFFGAPAGGFILIKWYPFVELLLQVLVIISSFIITK